MPSLIPELLDLFPDFVTIEKGTRAQYGVFSPTGDAPVDVQARVIGRVRMVTDVGGRERVSTVQAWLAGPVGATVGDRFTLPARFEPNQPPAIAVEHWTDEDGPHHECVFF